MTKTPRTDVHCPSSPRFDPDLYDPRFYVDFHPEDGNAREAWKFIESHIRRGWKRGYGYSRHVCGHCGHALRYAAIAFREDVREFILIGETCQDNRFDLDKGEFDRLRKEGRLNAERRTRQERLDALHVEFPHLTDLSYLPNIDELNWSDFLNDMYRAYVGRWITDAQARAADSAIEKMSRSFWERENRRVAAERERAARNVVNAHIGAVKDKLTLTGVVRFIFAGERYSYYGPVPYTFVVETDQGTVKFSTTSETFVDSVGLKVSRDDRITFSGTVKAHTDYRGDPQTVLTRVKLAAVCAPESA